MYASASASTPTTTTATVPHINESIQFKKNIHWNDPTTRIHHMDQWPMNKLECLTGPSCPKIPNHLHSALTTMIMKLLLLVTISVGDMWVVVERSKLLHHLNIATLPFYNMYVVGKLIYNTVLYNCTRKQKKTRQVYATTIM